MGQGEESVKRREKGRIHFTIEKQRLLALRSPIQKQKAQTLYFQGCDILKACRQINS